MPQYGNKLYWNGRYFDETNFHDWYCSYDDIQDSLENVINRLCRIFRKQTLEIMDIGCGTSQISQRIVKRYGDKVNILAIDQSKNEGHKIITKILQELLDCKSKIKLLLLSS